MRYFQCKENHFETKPLHAKSEENRLRNAKDTGFYTKLNVWGSLGLNFEYDGGPIIEIGGPIFLYKLGILEIVHPSVKARCCPQVSNFEGHVWPPSDFWGGHLKILRVTYYHQ